MSPLQQVRQTLSLLRHTRSLVATQALASNKPGIAEVRLPGCPGPVRFRRGTSDAILLQPLVFNELPPEYRHDLAAPPTVILDIGANIGALALQFAKLYPDARILSFEPLPENYELLAFNTRGCPNVEAYPFGLGATTTSLPYQRSDDPTNFGGGGCHSSRPADDATDAVEIVAVTEALDRLNVTHIDLIKIDTEGAEHDILTNLPAELLSTVRCIVGELHNKPNDPALLLHLHTHFHTRLTHQHGKPKWFHATPLAA
ncbi:MAG: FkbM family methyltransferase [Planctomycetota bacterium]